MDIFTEKLHPRVALKLDDSVFMDRENVTKALVDNKPLFKDLDLSPINDSKTLYGYNSMNNPIKIAYVDDLIIRIVMVSKAIDYQRFVGKIRFDGHCYSGFQIQRNHPTIQGELTKIYHTVESSKDIVQGCSRTDAGVHALNYYIHFDSTILSSENKWFEIFQHQLPKDIQLISLKKTHPLFHSRYDVDKKHYIYKIKLHELDPFKLHYEWFVKTLDLELLEKNMKQFVGTHDFKSFCKGRPNSTIRTIYKTKVSLENDELTLEFIGNGFLRYMIRIIVQTIVDLSTNKTELEISEIIKERSRVHTKDLAPAAGLYLKEITY